MKHPSTRYLVSYPYEHAMFQLPEDSAGTLYIANIENDMMVWFDNFNKEWHTSLNKYSDCCHDSEFQEVESFDNGYVNTEDVEDSLRMNIMDRHRLVRQYLRLSEMPLEIEESEMGE